MIDLIKRTMLTGVGLAVMTKDKVEELGRDLASQAKLGEVEGREFVDNLMKQSEDARKDFEDRVGSLVKKAMDGVNLVHKEELDKLQARVDALEAELRKHQDAPVHHSH